MAGEQCPTVDRRISADRRRPARYPTSWSDPEARDMYDFVWPQMQEKMEHEIEVRVRAEIQAAAEAKASARKTVWSNLRTLMIGPGGLLAVLAPVLGLAAKKILSLLWPDLFGDMR